MLKHFNGFDQFQAQAGSQLLGSLVASGYTVTPGLTMAAGRHPSTYALNMQPSSGTAGTTWSRRQSTARQAMRDVATNDEGKWIAVGDAGQALMSLDTITWQTLVLGVNTALLGVLHFERDGAKRWVIVGANATVLVSDDDGTTWTPRTLPLAGATLYDVWFANDTLVAVGASGSTGCIAVSTDSGETWGLVTAGQSGALANQVVRYGGGAWVVGGLQGQLRVSTNNGQTWASGNTGGAVAVTGLAFGDGVWLTTAGRSIRQSTDALVWSEIVANLGTTNDSLTRLARADGRWIAAGLRGLLMTSENRLDWTARPLNGATTASEVMGIDVGDGTETGIVAVGGLIGTGVTAQPLIFASLAPPTTLGYKLTSTENRIVIGFAYRATARGKILSVANLFDLDWPGPLAIGTTESSAIPIRNAWYFYELVIDRAAATVSLFVNDTPDIVVALPGAVGAMTEFNITWLAENGAVARLDDVYLLDSSTTDGATLVNRLGPIRIPLRMPTADSNVNWEGSAPGDHFALVGLLPPSEASYVRSAESGAQELFTSSTPLPTGATTILAAGVLALARKSDLDNRQLGLAVGAGSTQKEVIDTSLSITSEYSQAVFEKAPGDVPWTPANVLTTPFGVIVRP